jgi:H+/Cl- antiporter ClcA
MDRLRTLVRDWRRMSSTHKLAWILVGWEGARAAIFSAPLNGGVLTIAALLLGTETHHKRRTRRQHDTDGNGSTGSS